MKSTIFFCLVLLLATASFAQVAKGGQHSGSKPLILGQIDEVFSKELGENRILNIYLPEGYSTSDTATYPVIYLLDGSMDEDFIHVVGLVQFNSFEWVNRVPKSIVVGIANIDRKRDFTRPTTIAADKKAYPTTGHSDKFIAFLQNELQPFIDKKYKTRAAKTLIGESLGGLLATEILLTKPSLFNKYIIISPSLWWDNGSLLKLADQEPLGGKGPALFKQPTTVYIGVGKEGLTPTEQPRVMEVDANVLADKLKAFKNATVFFDYLPQENHATIAHQALMNAFRVIY